MDIERLKELTQSEDSDLWDYKEELIALIDAEIARQSVTSEEAAISKTETTKVVSDGFSYDAKPKQFQCLGCLGYFYMPKVGNYCPNCGRRLED